jgi:hypothetical protein
MNLYEIDEHDNTCKIEDDGTRKIMANFNAKIDKETRYKDDKETRTVLAISGRQNGETLEEVQIEAEKFPGLSWVVPNWGIRCVVYPGSTVKDDMRAAIALRSKPTKHTVFTHTGWAEHHKHQVYLHNGGAIGPNGNDPKVSVELPTELKHYEMKCGGDVRHAVDWFLAFLAVAPPQITWPMIAAAIAPIHGPCDNAIHITGRTGTYKSELASLMQSAYGPEMDARHLPGSWSSTANALEAQAYRAKNALFCIDDFIPTGTSWQVRAYQKTADQIIRGQGNQAGRARLTDVSNLQTTMYPRGLILSTGEDTPEGHSIRGRMLISEIAPGDVDLGNLSACQSNREQFAIALGNYIMDVSKNVQTVQEQVEQTARQFRDKHLDLGHARTPSALGRALASVAHFLEWATTVAKYDRKRQAELVQGSYAALRLVAESQTQYLQEVDPCEAFVESIAHILTAHIGHMRTKGGGIPSRPELLGWTAEQSTGDLPTYKSHGKCIGWIDWDSDEIYIDITSAYSDIRKHANNQMTFTRPTMLKRLKDAGLLLRTDDTRQRNTIRITAEQHPRNVLCMSLSQTLQVTERPNDELNGHVNRSHLDR